MKVILKLFYSGICGGFCGSVLVLDVPREFTFCKAFLLSRNGVADVFTQQVSFETLSNGLC